jgi:hypothetical protein
VRALLQNCRVIFVCVFFSRDPALKYINKAILTDMSWSPHSLAPHSRKTKWRRYDERSFLPSSKLLLQHAHVRGRRLLLNQRECTLMPLLCADRALRYGTRVHRQYGFLSALSRSLASKLDDNMHTSNAVSSSLRTQLCVGSYTKTVAYRKGMRHGNVLPVCSLVSGYIISYLDRPDMRSSLHPFLTAFRLKRHDLSDT